MQDIFPSRQFVALLKTDKDTVVATVLMIGTETRCRGAHAFQACAPLVAWYSVQNRAVVGSIPIAYKHAMRRTTSFAPHL